MNKRIAVLFLAMILALSAGAEVYKWVDDRGVTNYGEAPPSGRQAEELSLPAATASDSAQQADGAPTPHPEQAKRSVKEQTVYGTVVIGFTASGLAVLPKRIEKVTLRLKPRSGGGETKHRVDDPHPDWVVEATKVQRAGYSHHNFELRLRPGEYVISAIEIQAKSLWPKSIDIPAGGPSFTVPENSCVYLGPVEWVYPMFPPGSHAQVMEQAAGIARKANSPLLVYYHPRASLLLSNGPWSQSADSDNRHDKALREKAEASGCVVSVATQGD